MVAISVMSFFLQLVDLILFVFITTYGLVCLGSCGKPSDSQWNWSIHTSCFPKRSLHLNKPGWKMFIWQGKIRAPAYLLLYIAQGWFCIIFPCQFLRFFFAILISISLKAGEVDLRREVWTPVTNWEKSGWGKLMCNSLLCSNCYCATEQGTFCINSVSHMCICVVVLQVLRKTSPDKWS